MNNDPVKREPHGGKLVNLLGHEDLLSQPSVKNAITLQLNERQVCDLELLSIGGFSPLEGFMTEAQYDSVVHKYRLPTGHLFGLPVTLDTDDESIKVGDYVKLQSDQFGGLLGVLLVESKWIPDRKVEAKEVYKFFDEEHPAVYHLLHEKKKYNIGGKLHGIKVPQREWVVCKSPQQLRKEFEGQLSVAFQCRNPIHRAHAAMFVQVSQNYKAKVVVHPIVGPTKADDFSGFVRHKTYEILRPILPDVSFEYLPYNMMVGGPRECLQHLIIRKNYGFTHMIVGRDHAGCKNKKGVDYYGPYDAQDFVIPLQQELGMTVIPFMQMVYIPEKNGYHTIDEAKQNGWKSANISGTEFRGKIMKGDDIPEWFAFPEVVTILKQHYGPKDGVVQSENSVPLF